MTATPPGTRPSCGSCCRRSIARWTAALRRCPARCRNWSTASARKPPQCGAASTGCGKTSRSRPATTGSIPYIGDLLATRLVSCLDARAQRLDVAKTIYYRRRAGTLGRAGGAGRRHRRPRRARGGVLPPPRPHAPSVRSADRQRVCRRRDGLGTGPRPMRPVTSSTNGANAYRVRRRAASPARSRRSDRHRRQHRRWQA